MGVLNVAADQRGGPAANSTPSGIESADSGTSAQRVDIAQSFTEWLEEFFTGFVPFDYAIELNWGLLSPIFSVVSGLATAVTAVGVVG